MPFDAANHQKRDPIEEARQAMLRRTSQPAFVVPENLKGKLFSPRDCFEATLAASEKGAERFFRGRGQ